MPLITVTLRDAIVRQPDALRETAAGLGATRFETIWRVIMPGLRPVVIGACVLAIGRAMGETMAVLMVSGNALGALPPNIYGPREHDGLVHRLAARQRLGGSDRVRDPIAGGDRAGALSDIDRRQHARAAVGLVCQWRAGMSKTTNAPLIHDPARGRRRHRASRLGWTICGASLVMLGSAMCWIIGMIV